MFSCSDRDGDELPRADPGPTTAIDRAINGVPADHAFTDAAAAALVADEPS